MGKTSPLWEELEPALVFPSPKLKWWGEAKRLTFGNRLYEEAEFGFSFFRTILFTWVSEGIRIKCWFYQWKRHTSTSSGSAHGIVLSNIKVPCALEMLWHSLVGIATNWRGRWKEGWVGLVVADVWPVLTDIEMPAQNDAWAVPVASWPWVGQKEHVALAAGLHSACPGCAALSDSLCSRRLECRGSCATAAFPHCKWPWGCLALGILTIRLQLLSETVQKLLITVVFKWQLRYWWLVATQLGPDAALSCSPTARSAVLWIPALNTGNVTVTKWCYSSAKSSFPDNCFSTNML